LIGLIDATKARKEIQNMSRILAFLYGLISYLVFFGSFLYAIGFVGNIVVAKSIDSGIPGPFVPSLIIDPVLLGLFRYSAQRNGSSRIQEMVVVEWYSIN